MKINPHTKISEIVKADAKAIDAIASVAKPLEKLKNPFLRRVMASRVTLAQAAVMGDCALQDLISVLTPLGFEWNDTSNPPTDGAGNGMTTGESEDQPTWLKQVNEHVDVRPLIESGQDPLKGILRRYAELPAGNTLCVENSFIPYPLIQVLEAKGAESYVQTEHRSLHRTYFHKPMEQAGATAVDPAQVVFHEKASYERLLEQCETVKWKEIDVRHLEMPQPMHAILAELEALPEQQALYILHKRVPLFLLEALDDQPFQVHIYEAGDGDIKMLIIRSKIK